MPYSNVFNTLFYDTMRISLARNDRDRRKKNFEVINEDKFYERINKFNIFDFRFTKNDYYISLAFETGNILSKFDEWSYKETLNLFGASSEKDMELIEDAIKYFLSFIGIKLFVPIDYFYITRADLTVNADVIHPVSQYFPELEQLKLKRCKKHGDYLCFQNKSKSFTFYDKNKKLKRSVKQLKGEYTKALHSTDDNTRVSISINSNNDKLEILQNKMIYPSVKLPLELQQHNILRCEAQFKNKEAVTSAYYRKDSNGMRVKWGDLKDRGRAKEMYGKIIKDFNYKDLIASPFIDEVFSILEKNTL